MQRYAFNPKIEKSAKVFGRALNLSMKNSVAMAKVLTGMQLEKGKNLLSDLIERKRNLDGRYYTNVSTEFLKLLNSAESNAEFKGLDAGRMIIHISAHKGFTYFRPRRFKFRRQQKKVTNVQVVLEQR